MKLTERLENLFAAVAFAEEGEPETVRQIMEEGQTRGGRKASEGCGEHCEGAEPAKA